MATVRLASTYIGQVNGTGIYRVDLSKSGLNTINSITIHDDNVLSGARGAASGFDLDFVKLLNVSSDDAAAVLGMSGGAVFDFSSNGIAFQPGFQTPLQAGDPPTWSGGLRGTVGANVYDQGSATLGIADDRVLSLGEGGQVTLLLKAALATGGRYFYYGDTGGDNEGATILVSDGATAPAVTEITLIGTPKNDSFVLGVGANAHLQFTNTTVYGRRGDDKIFGAFGDDKLYGEAGKDWIRGGSGNDRLSGGAGDDRLSGGTGDDWVHGGSGRDRIYGNAGDDVINGGSGNDRLYGGSGSDAFMFNTKLGTAATDRKVNFDTVVDFKVKYDSFLLDNAVFKKLGGGTLSDPMQLDKEFFVVGSKARERDDYLIYNKKTGVLSYDADGSGSKEAVEFAQLSKNLKLTYKDFFVV